MGRLDHLVAVDELSKADLVISINYDGVYGNVVLEASSMGIPVVVLEHPGCQTQGLYGLLGLKRGDRLVGNIAKIIRNAVNNEVWLSDIGKNSEQFSLKHVRCIERPSLFFPLSTPVSTPDYGALKRPHPLTKSHFKGISAKSAAFCTRRCR